MVFPENPHLRVLVAQRPAVQEQGQFRGESDAHGDNRGDVEPQCVVLVALRKLAAGECDEDERDGGHQEAEADISGGFDAGLSCRELAGVDALDRLVAEEQRQVRHGVEDGVCHGGEERERH